MLYSHFTKTPKNGHTQKEIAEILSDGQEEWSRGKVKQYVAVLDNVGTEILEFARHHQEGRVPTNGTAVPTFEFTEWWFRNSGLYDLAPPSEDNDPEESDEDDESNAGKFDILHTSKLVGFPRSGSGVRPVGESFAGTCELRSDFHEGMATPETTVRGRLRPT